MKRTITILLTILIALIAHTNHTSATTCPKGSYDIGDNVCKSEPTGCPYGDSLPMDKCITPNPEPSPDPELKQEVEKIEPEPIEVIEAGVGK